MEAHLNEMNVLKATEVFMAVRIQVGLFWRWRQSCPTEH